MDVLDEQGRLFGLVNVIDALVVVLAAFVVVAGVAFVSQPGTEPAPETATMSVVLDLGTLPGYLAERVAEGDTYSPGGESTLTVSDVYLGPKGVNSRVLLGVDVEGPATDDTIRYDGAPLRLGRQLTIRTDDYKVGGTIRAVGTGLDRGTTRVLVNVKVDPSTANEIQAGDTYTLGSHEVSTVESVETFATESPASRRAYLGLVLHTIDLGDGPRFGSAAVRRGANVPFRTSEYALSGPIERVGAAELPGEPATREVTLEVEGANPEIASTLQPGMAETVAGQTNAHLVDVERRPATVLLRGQDGQLIYGEHPNRMDVTFTAELSVRETDTGPTFKGKRLQLGRAVHLDLGPVTVEATVVEIGEPSE